MSTSMKTQGAYNPYHYITLDPNYGVDTEKQLRQKPALDAFRMRQKLKKATRYHEAKVPRKEASISPNEAKFPPLGIGISVWRENIIDWDWNQIGPPPPKWRVFRQGEKENDQGKNALEQIHELLDAIRDRHSGYVSTSGKVEFYPTPEKYESIGKTPRDDMIFMGSVTTPEWDSEALSESLHAGEVSEEEFERMIMRPLHKFFSAGALERLIAYGAAKGLVYVGMDVHCQNGTLHFHIRFLKSSPLMFQDEAGAAHPRSGAPDRGRRKKGAKWVGGETLGLRGRTGKLVTNSLGVALCAADACRKEGFPAPVDFGRDWGMLYTIIKARRKGAFADGKVDDSKIGNRARDTGLGWSFDLVASRYLRGLFKELARANAAFKARREKKLGEAKTKVFAERQTFAEMFAKELLEEKDAKITQLDKDSVVAIAGLLPEWLEVVKKNMRGVPTPHAKIANIRHASGRLVLKGDTEVELVLKYFPANQIAKQLQGMLAAHAEALAAYDADAKHGIASAEGRLASLEAGWQQKYILTEPTSVTVIENRTSIKEGLRCAEDVRFVAKAIVDAFQRYSDRHEQFVLTPCEQRFVEVTPSAKTLRIRGDVLKSFYALLQESQTTLTVITSTDLERVKQTACFIEVLKESLDNLRPLSRPPVKEPSAPIASKTGDDQHLMEPQCDQPQNPKKAEI